MPRRKRSSSASSASSSKKSTPSPHSSQPAKFGIQHFFVRHTQAAAAAAAAAASSSTPALNPPPSQSPEKPQDLARSGNDGPQDESSPISPEATKQAPIKRVRFSPGMIIKQSQDEGGDEVTWKISPMNERLRSFAGKVFQGTDTALSSFQKPRVLGVCKNASGQKKFTSSPTQLVRQSTFESAKRSSSRETEYCSGHDAEDNNQIVVGTVNDDSNPFRTPPSALYGTKELGAAVGRYGASQPLDSHHQRKALLELLDQVGDAISVDEQPSSNFRSSLVESQKLLKVCGPTQISLVNNPTRAASQASDFPMFLLLEVSEKHVDANTSHQEKPSKVLRLLNEKSGQEHILHLHDEWFYSNIKPGDTVGIIGEFDSNGECIIDRNNNLLILHPDILVSGTRVASSYICLRRAVLDERLKSTEHSVSSLLGTLLHQIFEAGLLMDFPTREFLEEYATIVLQKNIESLYACDVSENEIYAKLIEAIPRMLNWYNSYKKQASERTSISFGSDGENLFNISEVMDIEEMAWAPRYGLKGVIDASIRAKVCSNSDVPSEKLMPLEFKTGKGTTGQSAMEHQVQLILYTLLMSERYLRGDIDLGLLYYLHTDQTIGIKVQRSDLVGTIMQRNDLATDLLNACRSQALPSMLKSPSICESCRQLSICAVYHKAQGGCAVSSGLGEMFDFHVKHLTPAHCRYLLHWNRLIDLEAKECLVARNGLLCSNNFSRGRNASSLSCLLLDVTNEFSVNKFPKTGRLNYQFVRQELPQDDTIMDVHKVIEKPAKSSLDCTLRCGDHVILSTESGRIAVGNGIIASINCDQVTVSFSRRLRLPGSNPSTEKADLLCEVWRIDKDEFASSYAVMRFNLMQLFMKSSESTHLRKLIVDLEAPRFESGCIFSQDSAISYVMSEKSLNDDQRRAVHKIITAKDYALILGMPGTGKTSTMVHAVKALLTRSASILLTSYTNSAVDNLLLKLKAQGIDFIRIGRPEAVHHDIQGHCISPMNKCSVEELKQKMANARVVGVTCLGINQSLLANKRFDICIMDEAGQTTLPVSLGPLMFASTFILVGDHYQLPPLVQSVEALENGMGISLFCKLSEAHPQAIAALECQYRMCAGIMQLSNALIYGNRLRCGSSDVANAKLKISFANSIALWLQEILDPRMPIVFVDTDALPAPELKEHKKINNPTEAYIISKIIAELLNGNVAADEIGVITPYNSQAQLIRQLSRSEVEIHTIDRYQGRDKDCIILSFVRSTVVSRMFSSSLLGDWRRINVALTRAKRKLIMVGSCMTLSRIPFLKLLIEEVNRYGRIFTISRKDIHHFQELKKCSETKLS